MDICKKRFRVAFVLILFFSANVGALELNFSGSGTQYFNISINYNQIKDISFVLSGDKLAYGSPTNYSYATNVTLDVGNDGIIDWDYQVYNSSIPLIANSVNYAYSTYPAYSDSIFFLNMQKGADFAELDSYGKILNNIYTKTQDIANGVVGINSAYLTNSQIMTITTNNQTVHAFMPFLDPANGYGLYVAEGGETYFCNSNHENGDSACDLTPAEAMVPEYKAYSLQDSDTWFESSEKVKNPAMVSTINSQLQGCSSLPCNITVKITSDSAGKIILSNLTIVPPSSPANITLIENAQNYNIRIDPDYNLTSVYYFYGKKPNVYIIPVIADDDNMTLTENETSRLNMLNNSLSAYWDEVTNYSYPLNFIFYSPYVLENFSKNNNSTVFFRAISDDLIPSLLIKDPAIVMTLDVYDYFPNLDYFNEKFLPSATGLIGQVYINGFSETNKTKLYNFDSEVLKNVVVHELAHVFVSYPFSNTNQFYSNHPASFSNLTDFDSYNFSQSPTGKEGYYEIYSILNQIRPFISDSDISNKKPTLSSLDKILFGILSSFSLGNYTFYSGNISKVGNRYLPTPMCASNFTDLSSFYPFSSDFWSITQYSPKIDMGTSTSFNISKTDQNGSALWVFANDIAHPDHFVSYNINSNSSSQYQSLHWINLVTENNSLFSTESSILFIFRIFDENNISNCSLIIDNQIAQTNNTFVANFNQSFSKILVGGNYSWQINCTDVLNETISSAENLINIQYCGDGICSNGESCSSCSTDCGDCSLSTGGNAAGSSGGGGSGGGPTVKLNSTNSAGGLSSDILNTEGNFNSHLNKSEGTQLVEVNVNSSSGVFGKFLSLVKNGGRAKNVWLFVVVLIVGIVFVIVFGRVGICRRKNNFSNI